MTSVQKRQFAQQITEFLFDPSKRVISQYEFQKLKKIPQI